MKRFCALVPGQSWCLTETGELIKIIEQDSEGAFIFEYCAQKEEPKLVVAEYLILEKYIEERGGALRV